MGRRPRKQQRYTVLVVGEGATERAFIDYLKGIYGVRTRGKRAITPKDGRGGDVATLRVKAKNWQRDAGGYDFTLIWRDSDLPEPARRSPFLELKSAPCVEAFLLSLVDPTRDWSAQSSSGLKERFSEYIPEGKTDPQSYARLDAFSRESLEALRAGYRENPSRFPCQSALKLLDDLLTLVFGV